MNMMESDECQLRMKLGMCKKLLGRLRDHVVRDRSFDRKLVIKAIDLILGQLKE